MALHKDLSERRNDSLQSSPNPVNTFFIVLGTELGYAATLLIGLIETLARFAISLIPGIFGIFMDKETLEWSFEFTIRSSIVTLQSSLSAFISLFTNLNENRPINPDAQVGYYCPPIAHWMNSFFSTPAELQRRRQNDPQEKLVCFSYELLTYAHTPKRLENAAFTVLPDNTLSKNFYELAGSVTALFLSVLEFLIAVVIDTIKIPFTQRFAYTYTTATFTTGYLALAVLYEKSLRIDRAFRDIQQEYLAS